MTKFWEASEFPQQKIGIAKQVFSCMAELDMEPCDPSLAVESPLNAVLSYSIGCDATVLLECSPPLAFEFASRLMSIPLPSELDDDVSDSLGELVNMIGGNLKGLMSPQTVLSTPRLLTAAESAELVSSSDLTHRICLSSQAGLCSLSFFTSAEV